MTRISLAPVALVLVVLALPGSAAGQQPSEDSAVGNVFGNPQRFDHFVFDARSGPSGENPSGTVTWIDRGFDVGGPVTCLTVTGNRATIGFENRLDFAGMLNGFVFVEDNGTPGVGLDNVQGRLTLGPPPVVCPPNALVYEFFNRVTSGELTVRDAQPLPTATAQCKNGGWRNFGVFKNQGDCVSFVATRGRGVPGGS